MSVKGEAINNNIIRTGHALKAVITHYHVLHRRHTHKKKNTLSKNRFVSSYLCTLGTF